MDNSSVKNDHSVTGTKAVWISPTVIMVEENRSVVTGKDSRSSHEHTLSPSARFGDS